MPRAKRLVEPLVPIELPQCEATRQHAYPNDKPDTNRACKNRAKYIIDGKHLCQKHAGPAALALLLRQSRGRRTARS